MNKVFQALGDPTRRTILKKLNNTIIPSINSNINTLNTRINNTDREIRELKRQLDKED